MESLIRSHQVQIYNLKYVNGVYFNTSSELIYDTFPSKTQDSNVGLTGFFGPTGPIGTSSYDPSRHYTMRTIKRKEYKAYKIDIIPIANTQESYDEVVCPFLDIDDIGVEVQVNQPMVNKVRLEVKPEFQEQADKIISYNNQIIPVNILIKSIFEKVEILLKLNNDMNDEIIMNEKELFELIESCPTKFKQSIFSTTKSIINAWRQFYEEKDIDYDGDDDYYYDDGPPVLFAFKLYNKHIPEDWYDYRYDVNFNDNAKLSIKCHEGTAMYNSIEKFLQNK